MQSLQSVIAIPPEERTGKLDQSGIDARFFGYKSEKRGFFCIPELKKIIKKWFIDFKSPFGLDQIIVKPGGHSFVPINAATVPACHGMNV